MEIVQYPKAMMQKAILATLVVFFPLSCQQQKKGSDIERQNVTELNSASRKWKHQRLWRSYCKRRYDLICQRFWLFQNPGEDSLYQKHLTEHCFGFQDLDRHCPTQSTGTWEIKIR